MVMIWRRNKSMKKVNYVNTTCKEKVGFEIREILYSKQLETRASVSVVWKIDQQLKIIPLGECEGRLF